MSGVNPQRRTDLVVAELVNQSVLYNSQRQLVHVLNGTAKLVWEMCDGQHSPEQMVERLRQEFAVPADRDVLADVLAVLDVFAAKELLAAPGVAEGCG